MTDNVSATEVAAQLEALLADEVLRGATLKTGKRLLRRLATPVRVTILGPKRSGKSTLLDLLAGRSVVPEDASPAAFDIQHGPVIESTITMPNGRSETIADWPDKHPDMAKAIQISVTAPLDALKRMQLSEVQTDGDPSESATAFDWAARRTDMVLWCTQTFAREEADLWSQATEHLKDNSFLVITKADDLVKRGLLEGRLGVIQEIAGEEFHSLFPVATVQAQRAVLESGRRDRNVFSTSGAEALDVELRRQCEIGQRANVDGALLFLSRYNSAVRSGRKRRASPRVRQEAAVPAPLSPRRTKPIKPERPPVPKVFERGIDLIRTRTSALCEDVGTALNESASIVLAHCAETANDLYEMMDADLVAGQHFADVVETVSEASELMLLMQAEDGADQAEDAVTLLLQVRRELSLKLAA